LTDSSSHEEAVNVEEHVYAQPKDFQPLFGLVDDELTGDQHHPHIHYIFADDDDDFVTNAALTALQAKTSLTKPEDLTHSSANSNERFIVLDLDSTGSNIVSAQSLSQDWQILSTELSLAPSVQDDDNATMGGMMLRVRGVECSTQTITSKQSATEVLTQARTQANNQINDAISTLADCFQRELETIQKMMIQWDEL